MSRKKCRKIEVIVPAAGEGTRFKPISDYRNKCMMISPFSDEVNIIDHIKSIVEAFNQLSNSQSNYHYLVSFSVIINKTFINSEEIKNKVLSFTEEMSISDLNSFSGVSVITLDHRAKSNSETILGYLDDINIKSKLPSITDYMIIDPTLILEDGVKAYKNLALAYYEKCKFLNVQDCSVMLSHYRKASDRNSEEYVLKVNNLTDRVLEVVKDSKGKGFIANSTVMMKGEVAVDLLVYLETSDTKYWDDYYYNNPSRSLYITPKLRTKVLEYDTVEEYLAILKKYGCEVGLKTLQETYDLSTYMDKLELVKGGVGNV